MPTIWLPEVPRIERLTDPGAIDAIAITGRATPQRGATVPTIQLGASGVAVRAAQRLVRYAGIRVFVDGVFGPATVDAVKAFQQSAGITVDGVVGPQTWAALTAWGL